MRSRVRIPAGFEPERRHAVNLVMHDLLGLDVDIILDPSADRTSITMAGEAGALDVSDGLFAVSPDIWLTSSSMPSEPLEWHSADALPLNTRLVEPELPVFFPDPRPPSEHGEGSSHLSVDVFGSAFFLTTRYEEVVNPAPDEHARFRASASLLQRSRLLHRPLADEYAEVLWAAMRQVWPRLERPIRSFRVISTHDVDHPFALLNCGPGDMLRESASRLRQRHDLAGAIRTPWEWRAARSRGPAHDPSNNFAEIMDADEAAGADSAFYFMTDPDPTARVRRRRYGLHDPAIGALLRAVHGRGHEIGLHPTYRAHLDPSRLRREFEALVSRCAALEIEQDDWGGRFHYLRWDARRSPSLWSDAGLAYDSSVGFAEHPGFRTGSCHPHHLWDFEERRPLPSLERPLVIMDISLTASKYLRLRFEEAIDHIASLKRACRRVDGEFVVLWHNDILTDHAHWELYSAAIAPL